MSPNQNFSILAAVGFFLLSQTSCQQQANIVQEPATGAAESQKSGPEITFASLAYDFGKVGPGVKNVGEFKFTNTGNAPLKILEVKKCCGVVAKVDKDQLEPGESGVLEVTYTSGRIPGKMSKKLYITTNDTKTPQATLTIMAETVLRVDFEPRNLKLLLKDENAGCPKITLTSTEGKPFSIAGFESTGDCLTADFDSSVAAAQFVLEPQADMDKLQKRRFGRVNITLAFPQPDATSETVTIIYQALSRFTITPSMLIFLYNRLDQPINKSLWIANNYGEDFEIESTASKDGHIKVISQRRIGNRYQFSLEITPPPGESVTRFTDTFTIRLRGGDVLEVACRGIYRAPSREKKAD